MLRRIYSFIVMVLLVVTLSACKSRNNEYDEVIDQIFEKLQGSNDKEGSSYIKGGREESNTYVYLPEGYENEALIIRVYYPEESKRTGEKDYDDDWYVYEIATGKMQSGDLDESRKKQFVLEYEEINVDTSK